MTTSDILQMCLIGVGIITAGAIIWQTRETKRAAQAANESATIAKRSLLLLNRPYLTVEQVAIQLKHSAPSPADVTFSVRNPSLTAVRVETIETTFGLGVPQVVEYRRMITPGERHPFVRSEVLRPDERLTISGRITYTDIFRNTRHRRFAAVGGCVYSSPSPVPCESIETAGANDEEEWGADD